MKTRKKTSARLGPYMNTCDDYMANLKTDNEFLRKRLAMKDTQLAHLEKIAQRKTDWAAERDRRRAAFEERWARDHMQRLTATIFAGMCHEYGRGDDTVHAAIAAAQSIIRKTR